MTDLKMTNAGDYMTPEHGLVDDTNPYQQCEDTEKYKPEEALSAARGKTMNKIQIKSRFSGDVLFQHECENNSIRLTLEAASEDGVSLRYADLYGADLSHANLRSTDLRNTDLCKANLFGADLLWSDLQGAELCGADLRDANLCDTDLCDTDLSGADLFDANLCDATIADGFVCDGNFHHITNVGSEGVTLELYSCGESGWYIKSGCFSGNKQEFLDVVDETDGDNEHGKKYHAIVELFCGV